jgi:hypothetical protein
MLYNIKLGASRLEMLEMWGRYEIVQALMHLVTLVFGGYTELWMEEAAAAVGSCRFRTVVFALGGMIFLFPCSQNPVGWA